MIGPGPKRKFGAMLIASVILSAVAATLLASVLPLKAPAIDAGVVRLTIGDDAGGATGTGVVITPRLIVTAGHVADYALVKVNGQKPRVIQVEGPGIPKQSARVLWISPGFDLAILETARDMKQPRVIACRPVNRGEPITVVGYPGLSGYHPVGAVVTKGIVSSIVQAQQQDLTMQEFVIMDAAIAGGNSGGPVFDADGRVIGIAVAAFGQWLKTGPNAKDVMFIDSAYNLMVPSTTLCRFLGRL